MIDPEVNGDIIFRTVVGSHLWHNERPESDIDEFICYAMPIEDVLIGRIGKSYQRPAQIDPADNKEHDLSIHEAGTVVHQLLKGNPNFLIGVLSNMPMYSQPGPRNGTWLNGLKIALMDGNISKNCYNAFKGYGVGHYMKYIDSGKDASPRRCNIGVRFFNFGISLLMTGKPDFSPVVEATPEIVHNRFDMLKTAYESSPLPDEPQNPELMYDWLIKLRMYKNEY
jgi:hypothetical protein